MGSVDLSITPSEATKLFEEKVTRLRGEMSHAERGAQSAIGERDKALQEVTNLQKEKNNLVSEIEKVKASKQQILDSLAETRKNVEASLADQETKANVAIAKATEATKSLNDAQAKVNQSRSQLDGIKNTFREETNALLVHVTDLVNKTNEALDAIPDLKKD